MMTMKMTKTTTKMKMKMKMKTKTKTTMKMKMKMKTKTTMTMTTKMMKTMTKHNDDKNGGNGGCLLQSVFGCFLPTNNQKAISCR